MTKDHIEVIAKKHGLSEDHVKLILSKFWTAIRYYLTNPLESRQGILIPGLLTFRIKSIKVERYIENHSDKFNGDDFYYKLRQQLKSHERQKSDTIHSEGFDGGVQEGDSDGQSDFFTNE